MADRVTEKDGVISVEDSVSRLADAKAKFWTKQVAGPGPYEPDGDLSAIEKPNAEAMAEAMRIPVTIKEGDRDVPVSITVRARESVMRLGTQNKVARAIEAKIPANATVGQFREAFGTDAKRQKLREDDSFATDSNGSFGSNPEQEFLQILGGPYSKQLYLSNYLEMHAKCFWELHHNPLARAFVQIFTDAIVGRGVPFKAKDPRFQKSWDEWAKRDKFNRRLRWTAHDLSWQGEIMWRPFVGSTGLVTVRLLDPSTIWEVISEPEDTETVYGYWQQYPSAYNIYSMMVNGRWIPMSEYVIRLIPAADVIHVKVNEAYGEKRGRSDFFPALAWFKRFRDYMAARITSAQFERAFVWDVEVDGDSADVAAALADPTITKVPKPGSAWWHNKAIKPTPMSAKVGGQGDAPSGAALDLVRTCAAAIGIPVEYLGWGDSSTKAQAITATAPWPVHVQNRQRLIETEVLLPFAEQLWTIGKNFGLDVGETWEGEFTWPEPVREDVDARLRRMAMLMDAKVISHKTFAGMAAAESNITTYDYEAEKKAIALEQAARQAAGDEALDRNSAAVAASRLAGRRPMGPEDRAATTNADRTLRAEAATGGVDEPEADES